MTDDMPTLVADELIPDQPFDPSVLTPETVDLQRFYTLDQLMAMPAEALEELWLACPDRPFYEAALKRAVDDTLGENAVVSDMDRLSVIDECVLYYTGQHPELPGSPPRIPTVRRADGSIKWFKVSDRIRARLESGQPLEEQGPVEQKRTLNLRIVVPAAVMALVLICMVVMLVRKLTGDKESQIAEVDMTATAVMAANLPHETPTPTPLALDDIDRPIKAGEDLRDYYPVLLEIVPMLGLPRVFPVQQRGVEIAEWAFEPDPDVASAVLGMVVRPVLGIPYTTPNAEFLNALQAGDAIHLRMSTGQTLLFEVSSSERVSRQEVSIFDQSNPGIALVLLQDPAGDRLVIYGQYPAGQEVLDAGAGGDNSLNAEGVSASLGNGVSLTVLDTYTSAGPSGSPVPPEWTYLLVDVALNTGAAVDTGSLTVELSDAAGTRYTPVALDRGVTHFAPYVSGHLEAEQTMQATLAFLVPHSVANPILSITAGGDPVRYALAYESSDGLTANNLDVIILHMVTEGTAADPGDLVVTVRLFNPNSQPITLAPADVSAIFSPVSPDAFPVGPAVQEGSGLLPLTVEGGQALDVELRFVWNGEPFVGLQIGGYRFLAQLR